MALASNNPLRSLNKETKLDLLLLQHPKLCPKVEKILMSAPNKQVVLFHQSTATAANITAAATSATLTLTPHPSIYLSVCPLPISSIKM